VAQENHTLIFAALSAEQKQAVCKDADKPYISYAFLHQSGAQHGNLKVDLRNDFTTGSNRYSKTHQQTLHLLDKYSKTVVVPKTTSSEGSSFAQKGGRGGRGSRIRATITFDKEYWKDKHASIGARRVIHHQAAQKGQSPMTTTAPALHKASRSLPRTPRT
jgi:hypothetical protein